MEIRLDELVSLLEGELLVGDPGTVVRGVAALDEATPEDASFLGNQKYAERFRATRAAVVLVPPGVSSGPEGVALIGVEKPTFAFSKIVAVFAADLDVAGPGIDPRAIIADGVNLDPAQVTIAAGAVIESGARIGNGTRIGAGTVIGRDVVLGPNCLLHQNVTVRERCVLGQRVIVQPGAVIGSDGYGFELVDGRHVKIPQVGIVVVEDDVEIGANCTIDRARFGKTVLGEGSKLDNMVQVGHNVKVGKHCLLVAHAAIAGSTTLGDYVTMAAKAGVAGHLHIGSQVVLAAKSGIFKDLTEPGVYSGSPARPLRSELRARAAMRRVPDLLREVQALRKEIEALKSRS